MPTYPNEAWPADAMIEGLDGTTDAKTGLPFIAKGAGPTSVPSYEVQYNRRLARLNGILSSWRQGMVVDEGSLKIGVYPMDFTLGNTRASFSGATGVAVADGSSKVVYLDGGGTLHVESDWPGDSTVYLPLAIVGAAGGVLTVEDRRPWAMFHVPSLEGSVRDRWAVTAHRASVGGGLSSAAVFQFDAPRALTLEQVQVYCSGVTATASVDVKVAGASVLSAQAAPVAGAVVKPTISDAEIASGSAVTVHVTTGGTGQISDLAATLLFKAALTS